jgi:hypothetical protein
MTPPDHGKQAVAGRYWPDRKAHKHRKRAHQVFYVLAFLVAVAPWFGYRYVREALHGDEQAPQDAVPVAAAAGASGTAMPAHEVPDPVSAERHMGAIRAAAVAGDDEAMHAGVDAMNTASRQAMRLIDPGRTVDREAARVAVQQLSGVRAAGWIDRTRLLVVTAGDGRAAEAMIATVCRRLEPLGDTVGVVVSVQDTAAGPLRETSRGCRPLPGERGDPQPLSETQAYGDGAAEAPPARRGTVSSAPTADLPAAQDGDAEARNEESMRILEETTPEM